MSFIGQFKHSSPLSSFDMFSPFNPFEANDHLSPYPGISYGEKSELMKQARLTALRRTEEQEERLRKAHEALKAEDLRRYNIGVAKRVVAHIYGGVDFYTN